MAKVDVVVIGAGAAGLTAGALLAKSGKKVLVLDKSRAPRRPRDGGAGRGLQAQRRRPPARGLGLGHHQGLRASRQAARPRRPSRATCRSGTTTKDAWGSIRDRYSGNKDELKKVIRALTETPFEEFDEVGRPLAARVDAPAHERPGRDRPLGVPRRARVPHRRVVGPLGERQPLRAQDALRGEADGRLLVLARAGLGRALPGPRRRRDRERRRDPDGHAGRARDHREPRRSRASLSRASRGSSRTRSSRRRSSSATPSSRRCRSGTCSSVVPEWELPDWYAGQIKLPRPAALQGHVARPLPRHRTSRPRSSTARSSRPGCMRR